MRGPSGLAVCLISLALNVGLWQRRRASWTHPTLSYTTTCRCCNLSIIFYVHVLTFTGLMKVLRLSSFTMFVSLKCAESGLKM